MQLSTKLKAHLALLLVAMIYGGNFIIAKEVMNNNYLEPLAFILLRVSVGLVLFWTFAALFVREKVDKQDFPRLAACALFGIALNQMFFFMGLELTTPINASLIMTCTPIIVLIISALLINEKITARKVIGIILGGVGAILLIAYDKRVAFSSQELTGDLLIVINSSSFGIFLVIVKKLMEKYHAITVTKWLFTIGLFYVLPFGITPLVNTQWSGFTTGAWIGVAYVLIGTTFLAYLLNTFALKVVPPSIVSIYIYLQPFFATSLALLLGLDTLSTIKILAGTLIFTGVYMASIAGQKRTRKIKSHKKPKHASIY